MESALGTLDALKPRQLEVAKYVLGAYGGALNPLDLLAVAAIHRSMNLVAGFAEMIRARRILCAAPLLRLQVDNCLRFSEAFIVEDPHEFALQVLSGTPVAKLKDRNGVLMRDSHLVDVLSESVPWVSSVYKHTSGFIHLSEKHIFATAKAGEDPDSREIRMMISDTDAFYSVDLHLEAIEAFIEATNVLLRYVEGWGFTKDNPEAIAELKKREMRSSQGES